MNRSVGSRHSRGFASGAGGISEIDRALALLGIAHWIHPRERHDRAEAMPASEVLPATATPSRVRQRLARQRRSG